MFVIEADLTVLGLFRKVGYPYHCVCSPSTVVSIHIHSIEMEVPLIKPWIVCKGKRPFLLLLQPSIIHISFIVLIVDNEISSNTMYYK